MKDDEIQLVDLPCKVGMDVYYAAIENVAETIRRYPVLSLYLQGGFSTPGISDIDLIIVYPDDDENAAKIAQRLSKPDFYELPPEQRQLFTHGLAISSRSRFPFIGFLYGGAKPEYVTGYPLPEEKSNVDWALNNLILGIEFLPLRWSELSSLMIQDTLPVRKVLTLTHSVCHSINLLRCRGISLDQWDTFLDDTKQLRDISVESSVCKDDLVRLLHQGESVIRSLMVAYDTELSRELGGYYTLPSEPVWLINHARRITFFIDFEMLNQMNIIELLFAWRDIAWRRNYFRPGLSIAPMGFTRHLDILISSQHSFSNELKNRTSMPHIEINTVEDNGYYRENVIQRALMLWQGQGSPFLTDLIDSGYRRLSLGAFLKKCSKRVALQFYQRHLSNASKLFTQI